MDAHSNKRELIGSVSVKQPAYMHTFSMTEHYIILAEFPLLLKRFTRLLWIWSPILIQR